ncbi:MAG: NADH:flavin oxidoreductase [Alphaproteobacteria bacterium]|nr:NADH:flavin oxidoreductase [Alphaproteobacteria bacterium]
MNDLLSQTLRLPSGGVLPNRLAKAAMSEGMADAKNHATERLARLYRRWAASGVGLLLSGNIQVDPNHLERPGNVVLSDDGGMDALRKVVEAATAGGVHFWAQLSHTGRQVSEAINPRPLSPSDVEIDRALRSVGYSFGRPKPMSEREIEAAVGQFARAAVLAKQAGFTGVQFHGAHGYLISQFLSPLTNRRNDRFGGTLENRARFLLDVIAAARAAVGASFPIGLKLNSSDFQKGGFTSADCVAVVRMLNESSLDLLELSGGSLEQPKVVGHAFKDEGEDGLRTSTAKREAYFLALAGQVRAAARMPVMVTGGFRTRSVMVDALARGELDVVGIGRPLIADPKAGAKLLAGLLDRLPAYEAEVGLFNIIPWFTMQMERMADGLDPDLSMTGEAATALFRPLEAGITERLLRQRRETVCA